MLGIVSDTNKIWYVSCVTCQLTYQIFCLLDEKEDLKI